MAQNLAKQFNETITHIPTLPYFTIDTHIWCIILKLFHTSQMIHIFAVSILQFNTHICCINGVHPLSPPKDVWESIPYLPSKHGVHPLSPPTQYTYSKYINTHHIQGSIATHIWCIIPTVIFNDLTIWLVSVFPNQHTVSTTIKTILHR